MLTPVRRLTSPMLNRTSDTRRRTYPSRQGPEQTLDRTDAHRRPWADLTHTVLKTGMLASHVTLVPVSGATPAEDGISVPYDKSFVKDAPTFGDDEEISREQARELFAHYQLASHGTVEQRAPVGHDTSGPTTDDAMTRSEEELRVGTAARESGRARLRKYVVTEQVQTTVPVQHEEVRLEREPITSANVDAALDGPALSEEEHEVTLYSEQPVVEKRVVPKERVRLEKDTYVEDAHVTEEVRSEQIQAERER